MKKTIVTITVDTEFSTHKEDMGIFGRIGNQEYGVPKLLELLDGHGFKATFFLDVYTNKKGYLDSFKEICRELKHKGHDLQLHTHPDGMFDGTRCGMKEYSLEEQIKIIKRGKELFREWFEQEPMAHRAGDWAANYDTLKALIANGIKVDSSMFYGWDNCHLNQSPLTKNSIVEYQNIVEIPASVFISDSLGVFSPYRLLSTDGNTFNEVRTLLNKLQEKAVPVVNLVYHSFSFLKWNKDRTEYSVAESRLRKFKLLLEFLSQEKERFEVKTIQHICQLYCQNKEKLTASEDFLPRSSRVDTCLRFMERVRGLS